MIHNSAFLVIFIVTFINGSFELFSAPKCHDNIDYSIISSSENKFSNVDCHYTIQCSKQLADGSYQLPIVVVHLNVPLPTKDKPTLLTFG